LELLSFGSALRGASRWRTGHFLRPSAMQVASRNLSEFVKVEDKQNVRWVTLSRPTLHNAFNEVVIQDITEVFAEVDKAKDLRAIVLTGEGASFSAGADLNWMKKMIHYTHDQNIQDSRKLFDMVNTISECGIAVIGRINGPAIGGGAGLVSVCDIALAVRTAIFGFTEVKLGLLPAVISPFVMNKIGRGHCARYFLTAEKFGATEAMRIGLVQDCADTIEELDNKVDAILKEIKGNSPSAMKACKKLMRKVATSCTQPHSLKNDLVSEIAKARVSEEGQEGLAAFLERRKSKWVI